MRLACMFSSILLFGAAGLLLFISLQDPTELALQQVPGEPSLSAPPSAGSGFPARGAGLRAALVPRQGSWPQGGHTVSVVRPPAPGFWPVHSSGEGQPGCPSLSCSLPLVKPRFKEDSATSRGLFHVVSDTRR